jgi:thiol:disulfide interchange protein DsbD
VITEEQMMDGPSGEENHFIALLGLAWLGGLILNLMPCVFPVIGLKIMGFVKQAGEDRSLISRHGWVFTLGVVLSFWVLVGVLLVLRDGLEQNLGWGFQLQEPAFVLVLAILLFLFGLSLSGVFEIGLSMTGLGAEFSRKPGLSGSFFSGVLATVVATPCMAPFLGVAVGAALTMPALPSFAIFTAIALGLSTPYLLLASFPAWLERLPRPGMWMESFKQFMAFPVYATVAWLIWTLDGLL